MGLRGADEKHWLVRPSMGNRHKSFTSFFFFSVSRLEVDLPHWCVGSTGAASSCWIVSKVYVGAEGRIVFPR